MEEAPNLPTEPAAPSGWVCQLVDAQGEAPRAWTVGTRLLLKCQGQRVPSLGADTRIFFEKPEAQYTLVLLEVREFTETEGVFVVTGYKPGTFTDISFRIGSSATPESSGTTVNVAPMSWQVASVLEGVENPQPILSRQPLNITYPLWTWVILGALLVGLVTHFWRRYRRYRTRRDLLSFLEKHGSALSPYNEFQRDWRVLQRRLVNSGPSESSEILQGIRRIFHRYLMFRFKIPVDKKSSRSILKELRVFHKRLYQRIHQPIRKGLVEIERAARAGSSLDRTDLEHLNRICRRVVEEVDEQAGRKG